MAMRSFRFLTASLVERLHSVSPAQKSPLQQPAMLESADHSPMNLKHYQQVQDVFQLAANLSEKIIKNHAYMDGNKRTALLAADMFLKINGYCLREVQFAEDANNKGIADAHVAVVTEKWTAEQLGQYYKSVATPLTRMAPEIMAYRNAPVE